MKLAGKTGKERSTTHLNRHWLFPSRKAGPAGNLRVRIVVQAETANSVIMPVERCGMWWQCSIQRAASPASTATVTMPIGGT